MLAVCMFTGHRPKGLPFGYNEKDSRCKKLKKALKKLILNKIQEKKYNCLSIRNGSRYRYFCR